MLPSSCGGVQTRLRASAGTISWKSRLLTSSSRSSARGAGAADVPVVHVFIRIGRFLWWPDLLGYVLQVHTHARPGRESSTHRVDHYVSRFEMVRGLRMTRLPAVETGDRIRLLTSASDLEERVLRLTRAPGPPAWRSFL